MKEICCRAFAVAAAAVLLALYANWTQTTAQTSAAEVLSPIDFWEKLDPKVAVASSGVLRGVQVAGEVKVSPENIFVCLPNRGVDELVLEVTTIDGQYKAEARFDLTRHQAGTYRLGLELSEKARLFLRQLGPEHVAYLAYLPTVAGRRAIGRLLPVHGEASAGHAETYEVKIHSKATKTTIQWTEGGAHQASTCQRIRLEGTGAPALRSFNAACSFQHAARADLIEAQVVRQRFRDYLPRIALPIQACP